MNPILSLILSLAAVSAQNTIFFDPSNSEDGKLKNVDLMFIEPYHTKTGAKALQDCLGMKCLLDQKYAQNNEIYARISFEQYNKDVYFPSNEKTYKDFVPNGNKRAYKGITIAFKMDDFTEEDNGFIDNIFNYIFYKPKKDQIMDFLKAMEDQVPKAQTIISIDFKTATYTGISVLKELLDSFFEYQQVIIRVAEDLGDLWEILGKKNIAKLSFIKVGKFNFDENKLNCDVYDEKRIHGTTGQYFSEDTKVCQTTSNVKNDGTSTTANVGPAPTAANS